MFPKVQRPALTWQKPRCSQSGGRPCPKAVTAVAFPNGQRSDMKRLRPQRPPSPGGNWPKVAEARAPKRRKANCCQSRSGQGPKAVEAQVPPTAVASPATSDAARSSAKAAETHALKTQWPGRARSGKGACPTAVQPSKFRNARWPRCQSGGGPVLDQATEVCATKRTRPICYQNGGGHSPKRRKSAPKRVRPLPQRGGCPGVPKAADAPTAKR